MPDGKGNVEEFVIDTSIPAHDNEEFMLGLTHMILVTRRETEWHNQHELAMIQEAMRRRQVTCKEVYDGFWKAWEDSFTPASGVEWRHIWKHIEQERNREDVLKFSIPNLDTEALSRKQATYAKQSQT